MKFTEEQVQGFIKIAKDAAKLHYEGLERRAFEAGVQLVNHDLAVWGQFIHGPDDFIEKEFNRYKEQTK